MATGNISPVETSNALFDWFKRNGGTVHPAVGITTFPNMGRGAIATEAIQKDTIIFSLPRSLTLSTRTSLLPKKFGEKEWKYYQLHKGWIGLILCMLWEDAAESNGKWGDYLRTLPKQFQTPMFWSNDDLLELKGTSIYDKIGKAEVEQDYHEKLLPAMQSRPDLFPKDKLETQYNLKKYHLMGSRILSRSFRVERWSGEEEGSDADHPAMEPMTNQVDGMDVDTVEHHSDDANEPVDVGENSESMDDEDDEDDPSDVAMVPLADMLNARYKSENARLCYDSEHLQMICIRDITAGEQIWNTYGDPPNSDLLRRHGHVDVVCMPNGLQGNPADVVEIRADLIVDVLRSQSLETEPYLVEKVDWWLEQGGDDGFVLETDLVLPDGLLSFIRLLMLHRNEWDKVKRRNKLPKPMAEKDILQIATTILERRLNEYETSIEADEQILGWTDIDSNKYMALVVRLGEKRILKDALKEVENKLRTVDTGAKRKRAEDDETVKINKKKRQ
ncbi:SET domain-containing protein [Hysterangium stoloniferum]|nr:SET domain-containing protein [Hysterangium stoloniferum]